MVVSGGGIGGEGEWPQQWRACHGVVWEGVAQHLLLGWEGGRGGDAVLAGRCWGVGGGIG